ncbi:MAG TPA: AAA family ATPase [Pseudolysinimonas sp.]|jgi:uridine kinase
MTAWGDRVTALARRSDATNGIRIIGIDGPSGSGKSTLAREVAAQLDCPTVEIDDFVSWNDIDRWWPRFDEQVLSPLLAGQSARYQQRDWVGDEFGDTLGAWRTVEWHPFVVVEGVTATRRETIGKLSLAVWVEAPDELRLARGIERDGDDHRALWEDWMRREAAFFAADRTRQRADLVVPGV